MSNVEVVDKLAKFENFIKFKQTEHSRVLSRLPHKIIGLFTGNQAGKTSNAAYHYVQRILGIHPIPEKNRLSKNIRCLSSSKPESCDAEEQDNTQYLELKKLLPYECIIKDITARSSVLTVSGHQGKHYIEFMSTKQELQDTGKVQRCSLWEDEEPPKAFREESRMRLLARGGDEVITLTPVNGISYLYDDVWNKASYFYRSKTISKVLNLPQKEIIREGDPNVACIQIATDDNPILDPKTVELIFESVDDPDDLMVRRYGVFKQISGRVHKSYNKFIHFIDYEKYFPDDIPYDWIHARGIDYHESRISWSIGWLSSSPQDEWFLWQEMHPAIDGAHAMSTYEIAMSMARKSGDYYYTLNLIDPLANKKQANTLFSVTDDLNRYFDQIRKDHGQGTPCYWEGWDTKDTKGRDEIKKRFKNAVKVGRPFNNRYREHGETKYLPTIWICNTCPKFDESIRKWSHQEWVNATSKQINDPKPQVQQKFSHDNMVLECLAKDIRLKHWIKPDVNTHRRSSVTGR